jgi:hypothetical protein
MPRSKYYQFTDEELRVLISVANRGPLSQIELSELTGIKPGNLSHIIKKLNSKGSLAFHGSCKTRHVGRPSEKWDLGSPQIIHEICIELEYRKQCYESEIDKCLLYLSEKSKVEYDKVADDEEITNVFMNKKYVQILKKRLVLGGGITDTLKIVSYPFVRYWLSKLREMAKEIPKMESQKFSGLLNNPTPDRPMPCSNTFDQLRAVKFTFSSERTARFRREHGLPR